MAETAQEVVLKFKILKIMFFYIFNPTVKIWSKIISLAETKLCGEAPSLTQTLDETLGT